MFLSCWALAFTSAEMGVPTPALGVATGSFKATLQALTTWLWPQVLNAHQLAWGQLPLSLPLPLVILLLKFKGPQMLLKAAILLQNTP